MSTITALPVGNADAILDQAADYLARYGFTPTAFYDAHDGCTRKCRCHYTGYYPASMLGAIRVVVFGQPRWYLDTATESKRHIYTGAVEWLNTYLIAVGYAGLHAPVFDWQTMPGRTVAEVCDALYAAASAYRRHTLRRIA